MINKLCDVIVRTRFGEHRRRTSVVNSLRKADWIHTIRWWILNVENLNDPPRDAYMLIYRLSSWKIGLSPSWILLMCYVVWPRLPREEWLLKFQTVITASYSQCSETLFCQWNKVSNLLVITYCTFTVDFRFILWTHRTHDCTHATKRNWMARTISSKHRVVYRQW